MAFPMGNLAALRTFRVLRALKTVAVVPGQLMIIIFYFILNFQTLSELSD